MRANRYFLLAVLTLIGVLNYVDRYIMSILLEAIKTDLKFSDSLLGLLSGTIFALFYAFVGVPVARLADRWDRGKIVAISLFIWSAMTLVSGFATSFVHLALARMGVGIGESGVAPSSHSLISDKFEVKKRATALAIYSLGGTVGIFLALGAGGWISDNYGWRMAFIIAGLPGIFLTFIALFLLRDPRKSEPFSANLFRTQPGKPGMIASIKFLWQIKSWRYAALATAITHIATFGISTWLPASLIRSYELSTATAGLTVAGLAVTFGTIGTLGGGVLADRLSQSRGISWLPWTMAIAFAIAGIITPIAFMMTDYIYTVILLAPYTVLVLSSSGAQFAIAQSVVKSDNRAMSSALLILMINLAGLGLGPPLVGAISDALTSVAGNDALRYAMIIISPLLFVGAWCFYRSGVHLPSEAVIEEDSHNAAAQR